MSQERHPAPYAATFEGLTAATALLTGQLGGHPVDRAELARGTPDEAIIGALISVGAGLLKVHHGAGAETLLQFLGLVAASGGTGPDGGAL
jgi:hypothetical protein